MENDPKLFKKLSGEIWGFRTKYNGLQYRHLAFWDKTDKFKTLALSTHGIVKKTDKIPKADIDMAQVISTDGSDRYYLYFILQHATDKILPVENEVKINNKVKRKTRKKN